MRFANSFGLCLLVALVLAAVLPSQSLAQGLGCGGVLSTTSCADQVPGQQGCTQYSATTGACVSNGASSGTQGCTQYSATTGACVSYGASSGTQGCTQYSATTGACVSAGASASPQGCAQYSATTGACVSSAPAQGSAGSCTGIMLQAGQTCSNGVVSCQSGVASCTTNTTASAPSQACLTYSATTGACLSNGSTATSQPGTTTAPGGTSTSLTTTAGQSTQPSAGAGAQAGGTATVTVYNSLTSAGGQPASGSRAGYSVTLNGQSGLPVQSQVTNQIGQASFLSVPSGIYSLSETPPPGSTFASMSINGDPAQLQQPFRLQAAGNYEIDITNQVSTPAGSAATTGCPSSVVSSVAEDRVWEQACAILPSVVSSSAGAGSSSSAAPAPASSSSGSTTSASNAAAPSSTSTASAGSISVGTLVQVAGTGNGLNVRSSPTTSAGIVTTLSDGATATVIGGPQTGDGYTWWQLDAGGWAVSDYLSAAPSQPSGS